MTPIPSTNTHSTFAPVKAKVDARFAAIVSKPHAPLVVAYDRDEIWNVWLNAFDTAECRQENTCSACKAFIRSAGGIVSVDPDTLEIMNLWNLRGHAISQEYVEPLAALDDYIKSRPIQGLFHHPEHHAGVDQNLDSARNIIWQHFHGAIPTKLRNKNNVMTRKSGEFVNARNVFHRALKELSMDSVETVVELIAQNSLYRGQEYRAAAEGLLSAKRKFAELPEDQQEIFSWSAAQHVTGQVATVRNSSIGTLMINLTDGMELDRAVAAYERIVAPTNYRRPTALVTPGMIEKAKQRLQELNLIEALDRRQLDSRDITAADALFVYRPKKSQKDVFGELSESSVVDIRKLSKVEEIPVKDFLENVVPHAKAIRALFEPCHRNQLVTLTGPQDPEAHGLMNWDNSFCWSYTGGVADAIKERVKAAGGQVDNVWMRCSLSWSNYDDLDLHLIIREPGQPDERVYHGRRVSQRHGAHLDVDMNVTPTTREPVENIYIGPNKKCPPAGTYVFMVRQYNRREMDDSGFDLEVEYDGDVRSYRAERSPIREFSDLRVEFSVDEEGLVTWEDQGATKTLSGLTKWGLKSGQFHTVRAITTSPNHWTKPVGSKHLFFLLEGCVADEKVRPFYNEHLNSALHGERKVMEVLADKIEVAKADGAELSGLGFHETVRNHLYVEVDGKFKRILKVLF